MRALARRAPLLPRAVEITDPRDLVTIYEPDVAMTWWPRPPSAAAAQRLEVLEPFSWGREIEAGGAGLAPLEELLGGHGLADLREMLDWHASLFEADTLGVRVALTEQPMCPGFHVDKVVCRLVWVMAGAGTEWVQGPLPVEAARPVNQLPTGAAAWFKGTSWPESCAIVHRSPPAAGRRLLATIDLL